MKKTFKSTILLALVVFTSVAYGQDRQKSLGLSVDRNRDSLVKLIDKPAGFGENLPKSVSLEQYVPAVNDQGLYGSSGGWATGYYVASIEWAVLANITIPEVVTAYAYDPLHTFIMAADIEDPSCVCCEGGVYLDDCCEVLYNGYLKRFEVDKLDCEGELPKKEVNPFIDFTSYARLFDWSATWEENTKTICQSLANNHPVLMGMQLPYSFFYVGDDGLFQPTQREIDSFDVIGAHAMTIVGYDDDKFGGAFRVVNSWGGEWGDNGYLWIRYEDFNTFAVSAYTFETELKKPDTMNFGDSSERYGRMKVKNNGFYEGYVDQNGNPTKGIYVNEKRKKWSGGAKYMKKLVNKQGGRLIYSRNNTKVPVAAIIY